MKPYVHAHTSPMSMCTCHMHVCLCPCIQASIAPRPHLASWSNLRRKGTMFLFYLITSSYRATFLIPCRHLGSMHATSPMFPQPYPPFVLVVPPTFHICFPLYFVLYWFSEGIFDMWPIFFFLFKKNW